MQPSLTKQQLRRSLLQQRSALSQSAWQSGSEQLCDRLQSLPLFAEARTVLAYFSFRQEPDLKFLFNRDRRWGFPRCVGKTLIWHSWLLGDNLTEGKYGIQEPLANAPVLDPSEVDLILVPAVACDRLGYRLGYGGGFYDRLLTSPQWATIPTIGIVFDFAYLPQLPVDPWDRKLHRVCTEKNF